MPRPTSSTEADLEAWLSVLAYETAEHKLKDEIIRMLASIIVNNFRSPGIIEVCKRLGSTGSEHGA